MASTRFFGVLVGALLIGGTGAVVAQQTAPQQEPEAVPPDSEETVPHPIEPILVQGYVKEVEPTQLTLTAPGAPVDLPLSLHEETRYIRGEDDVEIDVLQEGQLVRAALLPVGEDLVALVVEVVPDDLADEGAGGSGGAGGAGGDGLQGEAPPEEPRPAPDSNVPAEPMPEDPDAEIPEPAPQDATRL